MSDLMQKVPQIRMLNMYDDIHVSLQRIVHCVQKFKINQRPITAVAYVQELHVCQADWCNLTFAMTCIVCGLTMLVFKYKC